ncbi:serine hydrolase domain-containing protein [Chitinophaga ginsengisegetis]|uniref:serine hydrolase domain-containing protein n=1 Tax=Chitinophaga ginsengisegetis TaxID=393003 RepID=UPI000DBA180A|nr:serine hydrolase domain-containing protein [Chitinophaga ginsengisegetis]MDR6567922.1 CubicO group peptidase (beta-lactamase class C family) [Chitinophaga ginsengisegetis]MDR6647523.1 CubicO group peptidase (beta-lactamase class C family) [Chitinophaga ginsengisegetis]MDR6653873.1 CubicO group peptidase (beta-lactamase class C family) [Chitinophaga ginsengisegetis]
MKTRSFILTGILALATGLVTAQQSLSARLDSLLTIKSPRPFNGVVLITQNGKTLYAKAYGYANRETKQALNINDPFIIMSVTKQMTAVMVLQQVEKGRIRLQQTLHSYLPEIKDSWADSITIHQLLNHTSGVVWFDAPLAFLPGTKYAYSNFGYSLLKSLLERTTGKPYTELAAALFKKSGMTHSGITGHTPAVKGYREMPSGGLEASTDTIPDWHYAGAGVVSTARDLVRWNELLYGGKLLKDSCYQLMTHVWEHRQHTVYGSIGTGYGIVVSDDKQEMGHTGYMPEMGFTLINFYYPATRTSLIVMENAGYSEKDIPRAYFFERNVREILLPTVIKKQ